MLSEQHQKTFKEKGYLVLPEFFSIEQMQKLKNTALKIVDEFDPNSTRSIFSTKTADTNRDSYFLDSGDKIRCFFVILHITIIFSERFSKEIWKNWKKFWINR